MKVGYRIMDSLLYNPTVKRSDYPLPVRALLLLGDNINFVTCFDSELFFRLVIVTVKQDVTTIASSNLRTKKGAKINNC